MTVLHPLLHRCRSWLILATVGLAFVVGWVIYGHHPAAPPTPEQLCRERLGVRQQVADLAAGAAMLLTCINDVTLSAQPSVDARPLIRMNRLFGIREIVGDSFDQAYADGKEQHFAPSRSSRTNYARQDLIRAKHTLCRCSW
jgi:hypothetical protein